MAKILTTAPISGHQEVQSFEVSQVTLSCHGTCTNNGYLKIGFLLNCMKFPVNQENSKCLNMDFKSKPGALVKIFTEPFTGRT
jgi:hypothetical protein